MNIVERLKERAGFEDVDIPREYIDNKAGFMGFDIYVDENVLIPRYETSVLVDYASEHIVPGQRILEIGTGSGIISVMLAMRHKDCLFTAVDISSEALEVAAENKRRFGLTNIELIHSDLTSGLVSSGFDMMLANLPYVESGFIKTHPQLKVEPLLALEGGEDGLDLIKRLFGQLECLRQGSLVVLEIGFLQKPLLIDHIAGISGLEFVECLKDSAGYDRVFVIKKD